MNAQLVNAQQTVRRYGFKFLPNSLSARQGNVIAPTTTTTTATSTTANTNTNTNYNDTNTTNTTATAAVAVQEGG